MRSGYGPSLTPKLLLDFINAGGNVLLGLSADSSTPSSISSLLLELDISLSPDRSSVVVDHFNYDTASATEKHDVLLVPRPGPLRPDVKNFLGGDGVLALPKTVGQSLGSASPLLVPILKAPATAYSHNPKEEGESMEDPFATGSQLTLISAMQARNSARFTVLGSLEMLEDKWFDASVKGSNGKSTKTVNREFAKQLSAWTFKEVGVLKVGKVSHYEVTDASKKGENNTQVGFQNPGIYRIKNDVVRIVIIHFFFSQKYTDTFTQTFNIELSEYTDSHYSPLVIPTTDSLQLEFSMLSPFHRLPLHPIRTTPNSTIFSTSFKLPDQHGIFAFKVNYKRPFLTNVEEKRQVTVRHFAHDEWPRSWRITGGWVWVAGLWSVVGGFVAFVAIWLYCEPPKEAERTKIFKR